MSAILIFSKSADRGSVKTRLRSALTDDQCLSFHLALLQDTLALCRRTGLKICLFLAGSQSLPFDPRVPVYPQSGADLGERMKNAAVEMLKTHERILFIGIDSPMILPETILRSFQELKDHDVVLGPSEDGGYYLLALRFLIPEIFEGIPWGTETVLKTTLQKLEGRRFRMLASLWDVDQPRDLERLRKEMESGRWLHLQHLRTWFRENRR